MSMETTILTRLSAAFLLFAAVTVPLRADAGPGHSKMHPKGEDAGAPQAQDAKEMSMQDMVKNAPELHVLHMAGEQSMRAQRISMYALLVALHIEPKENLARLREVRETFERIRIGLRAGDDHLGLPATTESAILVHLDNVDGVWAQLDPLVKDVLASGKARKDQIEAFATLIPRLNASLEKMIASYEYYSYEGRRFSVLLSTFSVAESQQRRIPQMASALLLSAYGHEVEKNKKELKATYQEFERALKGLIEGDPELKTLAAPTEEIRMGYHAVEQLWQEFQPLLAKDFGSADDNREAVAQLAQRVLPLTEKFHEAFDATVNLYHAL